MRNGDNKSILIVFMIIFVLAIVLISQGYIGSGVLVGKPCYASPNYLCNNPILFSNGTLNFVFSQYTNTTISNVQFACAATALVNGLPNPKFAFKNLMYSLPSGNNVAVSIPCYVNGTALDNQTGWSTFQGYIWLNYTNSTLAPSISNPWHTVKIATVSLKVI